MGLIPFSRVSPIGKAFVCTLSFVAGCQPQASEENTFDRQMSAIAARPDVVSLRPIGNGFLLIHKTDNPIATATTVSAISGLCPSGGHVRLNPVNSAPPNLAAVEILCI